MHDSIGVFHHLLGPGFGWVFRDSPAWTGFGFLGNLLFGSRFVLQWLHSEKHQRIVVPPIFWHLSFWGSVACLIYALHLDKMPVIFGYLFLPIVYARNLILLRRGESNIASGEDA